MKPTAKSFLLDLLSTLRTGAMPVSALVSAAARFGLEENSVRVALARLLAVGQVTRDERGQYHLGTRAEAVRRHVTSWREVETRLDARPWSGRWIAVLPPYDAPRLSPRARRRHEHALRLLGFRPLTGGVDLRPDNLAGGVETVRGELHALGLDPHAVVCTLGALDAATDARARGLWDTAALRAGYRESLAALAKSERRLAQLPEQAAMVESFRLGGRVIRQIVLDPLLPEPLVLAEERAALIAAMRRYDQLGRACWANFMRQVGAPARAGRRLDNSHAPADTRLAHGPQSLNATL